MNEYDDGRIWFRKKGGLVTIGLTEKGLEEIGESRRFPFRPRVKIFFKTM